MFSENITAPEKNAAGLAVITNFTSTKHSSSEQHPTQVGFFFNTRSYATLRAADLDWIAGPGYSSGGYILKTMKNQP